MNLPVQRSNTRSLNGGDPYALLPDQDGNGDDYKDSILGHAVDPALAAYLLSKSDHLDAEHVFRIHAALGKTWHELTTSKKFKIVTFARYTDALSDARDAFRQFPELKRMAESSPAIMSGVILLHCLAGRTKRKNSNNPATIHPERITEKLIQRFRKYAGRDPSVTDVLYILHHDSWEDHNIRGRQLTALLEKETSFLIQGVTQANWSRSGSLDPFEALYYKHLWKYSRVPGLSLIQCLERIEDNFDLIDSIVRELNEKRVTIQDSGKNSYTWHVLNLHHRKKYHALVIKRLEFIKDNPLLNLHGFNCDAAIKDLNNEFQTLCNKYQACLTPSKPKRDKPSWRDKPSTTCPFRQGPSS